MKIILMSQKKKLRNSVFRGNSSGRFLHGPLLKWYIFTILQNILTFSRELYCNIYSQQFKLPV